VTSATKRERIAILGGGVGALSAAFYLTEQPGWSDKYEITVYQQGWRLGGKCASGHDLRPGYGDRIYEHGLHIFAGFYDQAFDMLRRAYDVLDRPDHHPNQGVWDAFTPEDAVTLVDRSVENGASDLWYMDFAPNDDVPGDDLSIPPLIELLRRMVGLLIQGSPAKVQPLKPVDPPPAASPARTASNPFEGALNALEACAGKLIDDLENDAIDFILREVGRIIELHMRSIDYHAWDASSRLFADRFLLSCFLVQTVIEGVREDNVLQNGFDYLDKYEWSEWLYKNAVAVAKTQPGWGAPDARAQQLLDWGPIASLYDYVFGYADGGDTTKRNFAAGTALRSGLLLISYKGHFFWKMRGAMGDVVIAPLYLALQKRGVKFQFFSRVTALNIDPQSPQIASIDYVRQVQLKDSARGYQPLINVPIPGWPEDAPLEGWPAEPLWDQLVGGDALRASGRDFEADSIDTPPAQGDVAGALRAGVDFDKVILGISVGGLKQVCASFPARLPASQWGKMFAALDLTRTCAMQLWLTRTMDDLGCQGSGRTLTGADQPYSSWADMSLVLSRETWDGAYRPRSIAYFCGQIPGPENGSAADRKAYDLAVKWLSDNSKTYWMRATSPHSPYGFDPKLIYDPDPGAGGDVLTRQYIRANCNPSDLYVQSPKNSVFTRMDADQSGLTNLFLAGDWTLNGLNSGCAESAARSGARCAQAIAGTLTPLPL
jgi:uncharacterized protein with NAD-binding domain and iron-sulfur cluster